MRKSQLDESDDGDDYWLHPQKEGWNDHKRKADDAEDYSDDIGGCHDYNNNDNDDDDDNLNIDWWWWQ